MIALAIILENNKKVAIPVQYVSEIVHNPQIHRYGQRNVVVHRQRPVPVVNLKDIVDQTANVEYTRGVIIKYNGKECMLTIPGPCAIVAGTMEENNGLALLNTKTESMLMLDMEKIFDIIHWKGGVNSGENPE